MVEAGIKTGIRIVTPNPQQIGADRIVDAVGAYEIYGYLVLVIDFGTATTYDYVDESGAFQEGSQHPESGFQQKPCGKMLQNFRRSRSKSRHQFSEKTRSQVCRQGLCTDRSGRPNILLTA